MDPDCGFCLGPDCRGYSGYRDPNCPVHGIKAHAEELKKRNLGQDHVWEIETVDSGHLGLNDFWRCKRCDAAGGPALHYEEGVPVKRGDWVFYADGSGLQLTADCFESFGLVQAHFQKKVRDLVAEGFERELAVRMEVAISTVKRWANGVTWPLPRMKKLVIQECRKILERQGPRK